MQNTLILLALAIAMFVGPDVSHAIADSGAPGKHAVASTHASHASQSNSVSQSASDSQSVFDDEQQDSDCCHVDCVCCMGQGISARMHNSSPVYASNTADISTPNMPNPHLEGLLRPPRFG